MSESKKDHQLLTALMTAINDGNASTVKLLLDKGAPINAIDTKGGLTPLMLVSMLGHVNIALMLLDKDALVDICATNTEVVAEIRSMSGIQEPITEFTALMLASRFGKPEVVKLLLDRNAQVDLVNSIGWTALMYASSNGCTEVAKLLIENSAHVNHQSQDKRTALIEASMRGYPDVVKLLLDKGAQINLTAEDGTTALLAACVKGRTDVVQLLLDAGANVNIQSRHKNGATSTPLMGACGFGHIEVVKLLLNNGAEVNFHLDDGLTVLMIACREGHKDIVKELINHGADIYRESKEGLSALTFAANRGDIISLLLKLDVDNETESEVVSQSEESDIVNQLIPEENEFKIQADSTSKERLNKRHILHLIPQLIKYAAKWREIGTHLKFHQDEMNIIQAQPLLLNGAPHTWLATLLSNWIEWVPGDARGSTNYANLSDLKSAVSNAGLGAVAAGLSLNNE